MPRIKADDDFMESFRSTLTTIASDVEGHLAKARHEAAEKSLAERQRLTNQFKKEYTSLEVRQPLASAASPFVFIWSFSLFRNRYKSCSLMWRRKTRSPCPSSGVTVLYYTALKQGHRNFTGAIVLSTP